MSEPKITIEIELKRATIGKISGHDKCLFGIYCGERYIGKTFDIFAEYMKRFNWDLHKSFSKLVGAFQKYIISLWTESYPYPYLMKYLQIRLELISHSYFSLICKENKRGLAVRPNIALKSGGIFVAPKYYNPMEITVADHIKIQGKREAYNKEVKEIFYKEIVEKKVKDNVG